MKESIWSFLVIVIWIFLIGYGFSCIGCKTIPMVADMEKHEKLMIRACEEGGK